jgi:2-keto-myo-inositol isomerase
VTEPDLDPAAMRDGHRVLVDAADRLDNLGQLRALVAAGYAGPISFEPFAASVHALADPGPALAASIGHIRTGLAARAA